MALVNKRITIRDRLLYKHKLRSSILICYYKHANHVNKTTICLFTEINLSLHISPVFSNFSDKHISKPDILPVYDYNKETLACSRHDIADKLLIFGAKQDAQYYNNNKETCK